MPVASMSRDAALSQILEPLRDRTRALARVVQVIAHQAIEADVRRAVAREQVAIGLHDVLRDERFFGRDSFEAEVGSQSGCSLDSSCTLARKCQP